MPLRAMLHHVLQLLHAEILSIKMGREKEFEWWGWGGGWSRNVSVNVSVTARMTMVTTIPVDGWEGGGYRAGQD